MCRAGGVLGRNINRSSVNDAITSSELPVVLVTWQRSAIRRKFVALVTWATSATRLEYRSATSSQSSHPRNMQSLGERESNSLLGLHEGVINPGSVQWQSKAGLAKVGISVWWSAWHVPINRFFSSLFKQKSRHARVSRCDEWRQPGRPEHSRRKSNMCGGCRSVQGRTYDALTLPPASYVYTSFIPLNSHHNVAGKKLI